GSEGRGRGGTPRKVSSFRPLPARDAGTAAPAYRPRGRRRGRAGGCRNARGWRYGARRRCGSLDAPVVGGPQLRCRGTGWLTTRRGSLGALRPPRGRRGRRRVEADLEADPDEGRDPSTPPRGAHRGAGSLLGSTRGRGSRADPSAHGYLDRNDLSG